MPHCNLRLNSLDDEQKVGERFEVSTDRLVTDVAFNLQVFRNETTIFLELNSDGLFK